MTARIVLLFAVAVLFGNIQEGDVKLDKELIDASAKQPIFVRFEDQLFKKGGDYEKFCEQNKDVPRSALRKTVLKDLHRRYETSFRQVFDLLSDLEKKGSIENITRFWIVNGFACDADATACKSLAARPEVSYVYLQRGPGRFKQQASRTTSLPSDSNADFKKATEEALSKAPRKPFSLSDSEVPWNLKRIRANEVWEQEKVTGKGTVVAISDAGFDYIPALQGSLRINSKEKLNGIDDDKNGYVDDVCGYDFARDSGLTFGAQGLFHGTMCSGIVTGRSIDDKKLVTGVAPDAQLMPLNGMGFLKVYEYALENGVDVISMSWMWPNIELGHYRGVYRLALEHMSAGGVLPVGGAGNFAKNAPEGKQICVPKDIPCCIAVAGVQTEDKRPEFSSMGPCTWNGVKFYDDYPAEKPLHKPDVTAPNGGYPVWAAGQNFPNPNWRVIWKGGSEDVLLEGPQGNSFAGPHAAGVAALIFSANPDLKPWQVKQLMEETADDLGEKGWDKESGAGVINALKAVQAVKKLSQSARV